MRVSNNMNRSKDQILLENLYLNIQEEADKKKADSEDSDYECEASKGEHGCDCGGCEGCQKNAAKGAKKEDESDEEETKESFGLEDLYGKVVEEAKKKAKKKKENNEYAICTASVGREDEAKYKKCKKDVAAKK
jgi:hypothetical protein